MITFALFCFRIIGSFGNGVLSYFTFLKWLLQLNMYIFILTLCFVIIPQAISTGEELPLESPQNVTDQPFINASRRDVLPNDTEAEDIDKQCNLVKPVTTSIYTHKPFTQLLSDFISGVVSKTDKFVIISPENNNMGTLLSSGQVREVIWKYS